MQTSNVALTAAPLRQVAPQEQRAAQEVGYQHNCGLCAMVKPDLRMVKPVALWLDVFLFALPYNGPICVT